jgi:hypothetical protein
MAIKSQNTNNPQLTKANQALVDLASGITAEDRKSAGYSEVTIVAYLKGRGKDLDTAMKLLAHFRGCIQNREKELAV